MLTVVSRTQLRGLIIVLIIGGVLALGCPRVRFVSEYDPMIDQKTLELTAELIAFESHMERVAGTPEGTYVANAAAYERFDAEIQVLQTRAAFHEKNEATRADLVQLRNNVTLLRGLHELQKDAGLPKEIAEPAFDPIKTQLAAITKLELAKKKSDEESEEHR